MPLRGLNKRYQSAYSSKNWVSESCWWKNSHIENHRTQRLTASCLKSSKWAHAKNILRAILRQFRTAYHKCDNILLHIAQPTTAATLRGALTAAIKTYPSIKLVWVVFDGTLYQLDRKQMLLGDLNLGTKK